MEKVLDGWPQAEDILPTRYGPLATFSCGEQYPWELAVNEAFQQYARGLAPDSAKFRVLEHARSEEMIGAACYMPRLLKLSSGEEVETAYILALGVVKAYRSWRMPDRTPIGDHLLEDTLQEIEKAWANEIMPPVWATVDSANERCHEMLGMHGFGRVEVDGKSYDIWYRQRGLSLDWRRS